MLNIKLRELVRDQYQQQDIFQRETVNQNESEDLGVDSGYEKYNELSPNNDSPLHPADDISLRDNESDNSEPSLDVSIYSADIFLEDYDSEYLDITPDSSQNSNDDDDDLEESLSDMSIDDDVIDDSNETGKKFLIYSPYLLYLYIIFTKLICFLNYFYNIRTF